jgi:hypothetical protein
MPDALDDCSAHEAQEAREPQVRDHDHHTEQERDGVEVDGAIGASSRQRSEGNHQACTDEGRTRAIDFESRKAADGYCEIGDGEDRDRDEFRDPWAGLSRPQERDANVWRRVPAKPLWQFLKDTKLRRPRVRGVGADELVRSLE